PPVATRSSPSSAISSRCSASTSVDVHSPQAGSNSRSSEPVSVSVSSLGSGMSLAGAPDSDSDARSPSSLSLSLSPAPGSTRSFPQAGASESEKTRGTMGRRTGPCYANLEGSLVSRRVAISVDVLALGPELDRRAQAVEQRDRFVGQEIVVDADPL